MAEKTGRRQIEGHEFGKQTHVQKSYSEIGEFCNLSECVVRPTDTKETLLEKVKLATIIGTFQSTLTNFKYVSSAWKKNCEEERFFGVSLTGIMDCKLTNGKDKNLKQLLKELREVAVETNKVWAKKLGINQSVSITCVKPSGTVSQLVDAGFWYPRKT